MTYLISKYPLNKDTNDFIEVIDGTTDIDSMLFGKISSAILSIEKELGIKPSGIYSDVRQRLDALQNSFQILAANTATHSTTIGTYFLHNWLSVPNPLTGDIPYTSIARLGFKPREEAGFSDGYGKYYFKASFTVADDISNFEISLWDITFEPVQITSSIYTAGGFYKFSHEMTESLTNTETTYEVRIRQTTLNQQPTKISSTIWNTRLLFVPFVSNSGSSPGGGDSGIKYITADLLASDFAIGSKLVGTIPANSFIQSVVLIVKTPFNNVNSKINIGDDVTNNCLMDSSYNIPTIAETYSTACNVDYLIDTQVRISMTGTPETGLATVIVYFH